MQRMGRAARTKAGYYFRVCLKEQHVAMQEMPDPEILRVSLSGPVLDISPFRSFLAEHSQEKQKPTGMTTLGSPGLSSQSVSGFSGRKEPKKPETDWDDSPGFSPQSVLGFSGRKGPNNLETAWDHNPGKPRLVIPVRFGFFWPNSAKKTRNGLDDNPGKPRLVIPVCFRVFWPKKAKNTETDWNDNPGKPRLVIPIHFGLFWPKKAKKPRNGLG